MIAFVSNTEPEDPERARGLVAHTLTQYVATGIGNETQKQIAMSVVAPALLSRATSEGSEVYRETSARLLELASVDQNAFRGVVSNMNEGQKAFMEEVIRSGRQTSTDRSGEGGAGQPTIALKMDFGT